MTKFKRDAGPKVKCELSEMVAEYAVICHILPQL